MMIYLADIIANIFLETKTDVEIYNNVVIRTSDVTLIATNVQFVSCGRFLVSLGG